MTTATIEKYDVHPEDAVGVTLAEAVTLLATARVQEMEDIEEGVRSNTHKASKFIFVRMRTIPEMRKTGNIFFGKVEKVSCCNVAMNWDYAKVILRRQQSTGANTLESNKSFYKTWGVKVEESDESIAPMLQVAIGINDEDNVPSLYFQFYINRTTLPLALWYEWNTKDKKGVRLTAEEVAKLKTFQSDPDGSKALANAKERQALDKPVGIIKPSAENIEAFRVDGVYYVITNRTLEIPEEWAAMARDDIRQKRIDRDLKAVIKERAAEVEEEAKARGKKESEAYLESLNFRYIQEVRGGLIDSALVGREIRKAMEKRKYWETTYVPKDGEIPTVEQLKAPEAQVPGFPTNLPSKDHKLPDRPPQKDTKEPSE